MADKLTIPQLREAIKKGESTDPLAFLEAVMHRQDPTCMSSIHNLANDINDLNDGPPNKKEWKQLLKLIDKYCRYRVSSSTEANNAARVLVEYMHPKRRSIETTNLNVNANLADNPLTKPEINKLLKEWNAEF